MLEVDARSASHAMRLLFLVAHQREMPNYIASGLGKSRRRSQLTISVDLFNSTAGSPHDSRHAPHPSRRNDHAQRRGPEHVLQRERHRRHFAVYRYGKAHAFRIERQIDRGITRQCQCQFT